MFALDTASVDVLNPGISVTKTVSPESIQLGSTATTTIVVTNTGDAHLTVNVVDDVLGAIASGLSLDAGASATYTVTVSPTADVTNTVTATGVDDIGGVVSDSATASIHVLPAASVAYIYSADAPSADSFKSLLEASGYPTTLVPLADVTTTDLSAYGLLIVGNDTGYDYDWGNPDALAAARSADRPIIGLGFGGATLFQQLDLSINWGNAWIGSETSLYVGDPTPRSLTPPTPSRSRRTESSSFTPLRATSESTRLSCPISWNSSDASPGM